MNYRRAQYFAQQPYNNYIPPNYYNQQTLEPFQGNVAMPTTPYEYFAKPQLPAQQPPQWNNYQQPVQGGPAGNWSQAPKGIMSYFQDQNGQIDIDKTLNTVNQVASTYHQVSPIVKGIGSFMKGFSSR